MDKRYLVIIVVLVVICVVEAVMLFAPASLSSNNFLGKDSNLSAAELAKTINYTATDLVCPEDINKSCAFEINSGKAVLKKTVSQFTSKCEYVPLAAYSDINKNAAGIVLGYTDLNGTYHPFNRAEYKSVCQRTVKTVEEKQTERNNLIKVFVDSEVRKIQYCSN